MFARRNIQNARTVPGFTLIELLVVIAIIGILSTISIVAFASARAKGKEAAARAELKQMVTAIQLLSADTGKWPNGCPVESVSNPELYLNAAQAGIATAPTVGNQGGGCEWTASDVGKWGGPYATSFTDPWGNNYYFDPDYIPYNGCAGQTPGSPTPVVVSFGPNGVGPNAYDCDDITATLR